MSFFQNKNKLFIAPAFLFILFLALFFSIFQIKKLEQEIEKSSLAQLSSSLKPLKGDSVNLIFVGDLMLDRGVEWAINKYGAGDFKFPFLKTADYLKKADILFANLEGPISDKGKKVGSIYSFRMDPKSLEGLVFSGFDVLSMANNHILDYGKAALEDTFPRLKENNIDYVGAGLSQEELEKPLIKTVKGQKIAFLAYDNIGSKSWQAGQASPGISWLTGERMEKEVKWAKEQADIVIVSFHYGQEYQKEPDSEQQYFSHLAVDSGADLVIGHHPHVVQEIEKYKASYITYSLGNFVFDQGFSKETMEGLLLKVVVKGKKITEVSPLEVKINKNFQPEISKSNSDN